MEKPLTGVTLRLNYFSPVSALKRGRYTARDLRTVQGLPHAIRCPWCEQISYVEATLNCAACGTEPVY